MQRTTQLARGEVFAGYRVDEAIGRGGMGMVYRATNVALNRIYALKVLAPELVDDERFRERFRREIRIAASLQHPHVVAIHYAGEYDGLLFLAMDYVHGTDLRELITASGALDARRAVDLLTQIASAIDGAHAHGLVHRDVKPANILVTVRDGEENAYLTDFGVAKRFETVADMTGTGMLVGTVDYMAPEQITAGRADARTDIYALGCVFFQMLSGRVPYERDNSVAKLFAHVSEPPPALQGEIAEAYPAFGPVLDKALAKNPDDRHQSAGDFARDATSALEGMRYLGPSSIVAVGDAKPSPATLADPAQAETVRHAAGEQEPAAQATPAPPTVPAPPVSSTPPTVPAPVAAMHSATVPGAAGYPQQSPVYPQQSTPPPARERSRGYLWAAIALVLVAIAGGAAAAAFALSGSSKSSPRPKLASSHTTSHHSSSKQTGSGSNQTGGVTSPTQGASNRTGGGSHSSTPGPAAVIREHLDDIANGQYQQAFALLSSSYQAANPDWVGNHSSGGSSVNVISIGAPAISGGSANVPVEFFARDRFPTSPSDTGCREFSGTAHMIIQGGAWRYDPVAGDLAATVAPSSDPSCPP